MSAPGTGPLAAFYEQRLTWTDCDSGFDCTNVTVPLDYAAPNATTIRLAMVRLRSKNSQGSLLLNPGGPGMSGVELARNAYDALTSDLVLAFDIVGFDPRGVGASDPVNCLTHQQFDGYVSTDWTPDTPQEIEQLSALAPTLGKGCARDTPEIAAHMGTVDAARDMDIIRAALGEPKLNYLGFSYGTLLGAQYADLFPTRVGRMVLDSVLPGSLTPEQLNSQQANSYDTALRRFIADCLPRADCPLKGTVPLGVARLQRFLADLDTRPITGAPGRPLTQSLAITALLASMFFPPGTWTTLRAGLTQAFAGNGSALLAVTDQWNGRQPDGTYTVNFAQASSAIWCLDLPGVGDPAHVAELAVAWAKTAPVFGPFQAWSTLSCWQWAPAHASTPTRAPLHASGSAPILLVSTRHDPATPYRWGQQVATELDNATLLTYDAEGHTAYHRGSDCIDTAVDAYLIRGTMPAKGTTCSPNQ